MVSGILAYKFGAAFAWITSLSVGAYIAFTLAVTQVLCILQHIPYDEKLAFCHIHPALTVIICLRHLNLLLSFSDLNFFG